MQNFPHTTLQLCVNSQGPLKFTCPKHFHLHPAVEEIQRPFLQLLSSIYVGFYQRDKSRADLSDVERLKDGNVHICFSFRSGYRPSMTPPPALGN